MTKTNGIKPGIGHDPDKEASGDEDGSSEYTDDSDSDWSSDDEFDGVGKDVLSYIKFI